MSQFLQIYPTLMGFLYILQLCSLIAKVSIHDPDRDVVEALDRVSVDRLLSLHFSLEVL